MACCVGTQSQVNLAIMVKMPSLWRHAKKIQNEKTFFSLTRRLAESVEGLNSSQAQLAGK